MFMSSKSDRPPITAQNATEVIGQLLLPDVHPVIVDLEKSQGNRIYDGKSKRTYLDCFSYFASNPVGHNHPKMFDADFERKLLRVARTKPASSDFHTVEMAEFVDAFHRFAVPAYMKYAFFVEGGGLGVENGLKVAFDWKVRLNMARGEQREVGTKVIHFEQAFHGRGGYGLSLTNTADPRKTKYFPKFSWPRIVNPKLTFPLTEETLRRTLEQEALAEQQIRAAFAEHGNDIAAIVIETIQGEGGDNHFRPEFHRTLRTLADEFDAFLIYDEVQTGGGMTGKFWAVDHYGIEPDIICFGKKLQVCGIIVGSRVDTVEHNVFHESSRINSTWGGNLVDMVRAQRYLEIIDEEALLDNATLVGEYLLGKLQKLCLDFPQVFSNARGKGLMCAIDASSAELRDKLQKEILQQGAIILKCGLSSLRFRPSLTFSRAEADELHAILEASAKAHS